MFLRWLFGTSFPSEGTGAGKMNQGLGFDPRAEPSVAPSPRPELRSPRSQVCPSELSGSEYSFGQQALKVWTGHHSSSSRCSLGFKTKKSKGRASPLVFPERGGGLWRESLSARMLPQADSGPGQARPGQVSAVGGSEGQARTVSC